MLVKDIVNYMSELDWKLCTLGFISLFQFVSFIQKTFVLNLVLADDVTSKPKSNESHKHFVTVNVFKGTGIAISSSPFSTKIIAYCRLAGIPHIVQEADIQKAPKSKVPYISHDGNIVGDSQLIIRYLEKVFNVSEMAKTALSRIEFKVPFVPFSKLTAEQQALSDMIRITCEGELYWGLASTRWLGKGGPGNNNEIKFTFECVIRKVECTVARYCGIIFSSYTCVYSPSDNLYDTREHLSRRLGSWFGPPFTERPDLPAQASGDSVEYNLGRKGFLFGKLPF